MTKVFVLTFPSVEGGIFAGWSERRQCPKLSEGLVLATSLLRGRIVDDWESSKGLKFLVFSDQIGLVPASVITKLRSVFDYAGMEVREALRPRPCSILGGFAADLLRSRSDLMAENAMLRQQLIVAARKVKRPIFRRRERTNHA